jgi:uncharacterized glyoxalase superfamily protein PhnB
MTNGSVPVDTILPHIFYRDVGEAIVWLSTAFGFCEHYRYGDVPGQISGAQIHLGNAWLMLKKANPGYAAPSQVGYATQSLTIFVEDVDSHFEKAKSAGARILEEPHETVYGELQYAAEDLDGHHWLFSRHARNVNPADWGATIAQPATMPAQISPMLAVADGNAAIEFYKAAFDAIVLWQLENGGHVVAGLSIHGAALFLAQESPSYGTRSPASAGFTTVRIELFVDDPVAMHRQALAAGAIERSPVVEHSHATAGLSPIRQMLQGAVVDPFGHMWLVGKFLA